LQPIKCCGVEEAKEKREGIWSQATNTKVTKKKLKPTRKPHLVPTAGRIFRGVDRKQVVDIVLAEMAKSLKQLFFRSKPEIQVSNEIGEIKIYLPTITDKLDPLYYQFLKQKHLYVVCPLHSTCLELKLRIKGIIKIKIERITLFYLGAILDNEQVRTRLVNLFVLPCPGSRSFQMKFMNKNQLRILMMISSNQEVSLFPPTLSFLPDWS
jgi:hypothetical protein